MADPNRKLVVAPTRGSEAAVGDRGLLFRPNCLWVAGRTGFGSVGTGKVGSDRSCYLQGRDRCFSCGGVQSDGHSAVVREAGVNSDGMELTLGRTSPGIGSVGEYPEGGMEENLKVISRGVIRRNLLSQKN
jgi:hypothetical protein